ncbi:MAG TPA: TetR family transcriptional regulator [Sphingobium sp.]|nr:TetR family transcriptional regulator [Sphingobium sp.]
MVTSSSCPAPPRERNAAATRRAILDVALRQFARESYENVGLREMGREAGVDPALIYRYFGSKEALFREVLHAGHDDSLLDDVDAAGLPARLAALIVEKGGNAADPEQQAAKMERLFVILRSASSPHASAIASAAINEDFIAPIVALLDGEDARMRASLALSVMIGSIIVRNMMSVSSLCEVDPDRVRTRLTALLETALDEA